MAGYIGTQAVSVNTTSATISDDLAVGDDLTVTDDAAIGGLATVGGTLAVTGVVTANAGVVVDEMTLDGDTLTATDDFIIDAAVDITLDAGGSDILLKAAGAQIGSISLAGSNVILSSAVSDEDMIFKGNDGGSVIDALSLDMSEAGAATFNSSVIIPHNLQHAGDSDTMLQFSDANTIRLVAGNVETFKTTASEVTINEGSADIDFRVKSAGNANMLSVDGGANTVQVATTLTFGGSLNVSSGGIGVGESGSLYRRMYWNESSNTMRFWNGSNEAIINTAGAFVDASDVRLKKDIADIEYGIDTVKSLKPRKYKMKDTDSEQIGFVAQEMEAHIPEVVSTGIAPDGGEQKGISYGQLTAVLTKAIQEQQTLIEALTARITALES